jgi:DNA-binding HxlR family transcriptional regulator
VAVSELVTEVAGAERRGVPPAACPSRVVLDHVTSKWGVLVLIALADRTLRWGELRRAVEGVSEKMLAQTLKTFEQDGLVSRDARPVVPPHVEYSLTPLGVELVGHLLPLMEWLVANAPVILGLGDSGGISSGGGDPAIAR